MIFLAMDRVAAGVEPERDIVPHLPEEARGVWQLMKQGVLRNAYFRQDHPGVVLLLESDSIEAARAALAGLPLAKAGTMTFDLIPLGPYVGLELLFAHEASAG